jgi:hypothetical protein
VSGVPRSTRRATTEPDVVSESRISYLSMEIALHPAMPTYSGGLGMLAGDMLRAAADRELPMVAVTLLRPLPGAIITVWPARGGEEIAHQHADQNGRFEIALKPGTYLVVPLPPRANASLPRGKTETVEVPVNRFLEMVVDYDTGIR